MMISLCKQPFKATGYSETKINVMRFLLLKVDVAANIY